MSDEPLDPAVSQRAEEVTNLKLLLSSGGREYALRSLDERGGAQELVRQQYSGRYPFELLQNANDAARETGTSGRATFVLTETALLVADNGTGFGEQQVKAICSLGRSSKGPGTSIGHKGLGFKSVGEITDQPQIISSGTSFQFDAARLSRDLLGLFTALPPKQRFPVYAFPYPVADADVDADAEHLRRLRADGFATVIRLPIRSDVERATVARHLVENLYPRLLLFLPNIDHLELRGTDSDFAAEVARQDDGTVEHVLVETDHGSEEWLIYRGAATPNPAVLEPMGEAWSEVKTVRFAVAVPLDEDSQPVSSETFPLHVYFPTEESPGLHIAVHAEWALTMDRRRIAGTPEAIEFNRFLLDSVADFVATSVAVDLVERSGETAASVNVLLPLEVEGIDGGAARLVNRWRELLSEVAFLPFVDDALHRPVDAQLLPAGVPDPRSAHALTVLPPDETMRPDVEAIPSIRKFVGAVSRRSPLGEADFLSLMSPPTTETVHALYSFLVGWRNTHGLSLISELQHVPCVLTTNGQFLAPAEQTIFFARRDSSLPDDIPVPIAALPEVEGAQGLLTDLGVKDFEWRDLIREYLVKILESPTADAAERERAMGGLRAYQAVRRSGGEEVGALLGRVLVPTRLAGGSEAVDLRRADQVYFGGDWTGSTRLEQIYGPFGEPEFLAAEVPEDPDERRTELDFYRMLGVVDYPRLDSATGRYVVGGSRHPHSDDDAFTEWLSAFADEVRVCPQQHTTSQELTVSFKLDRFTELAKTRDPGRLLPLWHELALHWGKVYEEGLDSTIRCNHGWHSGDKNRRVESLFGHLLRTRAWVPVELAGKPAVARPAEAWVETTEPPPRIRERIPRISDAMYRTRGGSALATGLGLIEAGRPGVDDLLRLLESVAGEADARGSSNREIDLAARWVLRTIDDVLPPGSDPHPDPGNVRVLASDRGSTSFVAQPPFAEDALLRDTWAQLRPVLSADTGLTRLTSYLCLVKLDDAVTTTPVAFEEHHGSALETVRRKFDATKPHIFALVLAENSRAEARVRPALRRLELVVCDRLVLKYKFESDEVEREDATCYIATRQELHGRARRNIGTAYLELDRETREPDWFAVGRQLAQHLDVAGHADAITMLLKMDKGDRERMMTDRQIPEEAVAEARERLQLPLEDEQESHSTLDALIAAASSAVHEPADDFDYEPTPQPEAELQLMASTHEAAVAAEASAASNIDWDSVELVDATPVDLAAHGDRPNRRASAGTVGISTAPTVESEIAKVATGKLGEKIAYRKERERVASFGGNPDAVFWRAKNDELAPIDIISIDEGGDRIYIEVKATSASDPGTPFDISRSELLEAVAYGDRYYIYRVTDTNTATPRITRWADPMKLIRENQGRLLLSGAQMELGLATATDSHTGEFE
ncbi:MAG: DUF3883 domain-containing protein [Nocardioides sp.]|nr:DUF3883 domain-containing protein [Nocardioides sp.]